MTAGVDIMLQRRTAGARAWLIELLGELTPAVGANGTAWAGCMVYRFDAPVPPTWDEVGALSLCLVAQGRKIVSVGGNRYPYDPYRYLVMTRPLRLQFEIIEASPEMPFLSMVLQIPAALVGEVLVEILGGRECPGASEPQQPIAEAYVSAVDGTLTDAVVRFLSAIQVDAERRVLAPMILREIIFWLLQHSQASRLKTAAIHENASHKILAAIQYMEAHIDEGLDVSTIANHVGMSTSAFAHSFKAITTTSPIQFLKRKRLERARKLMLREGYGASEAAFKVGYASPSQFSREFKRYFGEGPHGYAQQFRNAKTLMIS